MWVYVSLPKLLLRFGQWGRGASNLCFCEHSHFFSSTHCYQVSKPPPLVYWVTETTNSGHKYANARNVVITTIMKMKYYVSKVKTYGSSYCTTAFVLMSKLVIETSRFLKTIKCFYLQIARSLTVKLVSLHVGKVTQRFPMTYNI